MPTIHDIAVFFFLFSFLKRANPLILMHQMHQDSLTVYCEAWCISIILFARLKIASIFACSEPFCILFSIHFPSLALFLPSRHCGFDPQSPDRSPSSLRTRPLNLPVAPLAPSRIQRTFSQLHPLFIAPPSRNLPAIPPPQASNPLFESKSTPNAPNRTNLPLWSKKVSPVYSQAFSYLAPNLPFPLKRKLWIYLDGIVKGCTFALAFKDSGSTKESS